jgi:hypothetical protein
MHIDFIWKVMHIEFIKFIWIVYALNFGSKFLAIRCILSRVRRLLMALWMQISMVYLTIR